jgi:hypothetical protein
MSQKEKVWVEFMEIRSMCRDLLATANWMARKRDEAMRPDDYVYFSQECNKFLAEHSNAVNKENQLHFELVKLASTEDNNILSNDMVNT